MLKVPRMVSASLSGLWFAWVAIFGSKLVHWLASQWIIITPGSCDEDGGGEGGEDDEDDGEDEE